MALTESPSLSNNSKIVNIYLIFTQVPVDRHVRRHCLLCNVPGSGEIELNQIWLDFYLQDQLRKFLKSLFG